EEDQSDELDSKAAAKEISKVSDSSETSTDAELVNWKKVYGKAVGRSHLKDDPPTPCQDAAIAVLDPRPAILVADGAGSAPNSHLGSQQVTKHLREAIKSKNLEAIQRKLLDQEEFTESDDTVNYAHGFIKEAISSLKKLSQEEGYPIDSLKCTLLVAVLGKQRLFWLKVGDGFIVIEKNQSLQLVGPLGKGEFENRTNFVTENIRSKNIHYGFVTSRNITGVAAFTDGTAEKLVSTDGKKIAGAISDFFNEIREDKLTKDKLTQFLEDPQVWATPWGNDDRSLALLSK
ncbi:MAG: protein phosphatase 2C domain-containing protein, partial [Moorea sp. SIO3I7]|nr:protein phosphatase 2C domain-containing protein [Moorena sp. SIO3I7]